MQKANKGFIARLARSAELNIADGYYLVERVQFPRRSLKQAILKSKRIPLIAEIKFKSPAEGRLRESNDVGSIARAYERGGVAGISVLTEPRNFDGNIGYLPVVKRAVNVPVLMKDIIIDPVQIDAAERAGADAVLLIMAIFARGYSRMGLDEMISHAHKRGLEVLLETHDDAEYALAFKTEADLVGINNRNLENLEVSLETSKRLLDGSTHLKPVICESGISTREQMLELRALGADGFLVGSAIMKSNDIEEKVRSLTGA